MALFGRKQKWKPEQSEQDFVGDPVGAKPDKYVGSRDVAGLDRFEYELFLKTKDVALILFYHPMFQCEATRRNFKKAARITKRLGHGYAAVNCGKERELCNDLPVLDLPSYNIYTRGRLAGSLKETHKMTAEALKNWIETITVYDDSGKEVYSPKK